jgi:hypothetical protein
VGAIAKSPYFGLFEVQFDNQMIYTDAKAKYVIVGSVYEVEGKVNLTEQRLRKLNRVDVASLPLDLAFKRVKGNGERKLIVFSDADCPFCANRERTEAGRQCHDLYLPAPDRRVAPRFGAQVQDYLVCGRQRRRGTLFRQGALPNNTGE